MCMREKAKGDGTEHRMALESRSGAVSEKDARTPGQASYLHQGIPPYKPMIFTLPSLNKMTFMTFAVSNLSFTLFFHYSSL